uniref:Uncharacterized protein n=1 Tax=Leviviridae sp. TaxID=2027243 RepID=A0A514DBL9_9VIRU|nr:MAG: hypothetical protein H2Rhizo31470e2415_000002 [Leviviridae sp.]
MAFIMTLSADHEVLRIQWCEDLTEDVMSCVRNRVSSPFSSENNHLDCWRNISLVRRVMSIKDMYTDGDLWEVPSYRPSYWSSGHKDHTDVGVTLRM